MQLSPDDASWALAESPRREQLGESSVDSFMLEPRRSFNPQKCSKRNVEITQQAIFFLDLIDQKSLSRTAHVKKSA